MTRFLQILLTLGLVALLVGVLEVFTGTRIFFTTQGWWRGAMACWMLLVATRLTYLDKKP